MWLRKDTDYYNVALIIHNAGHNLGPEFSDNMMDTGHPLTLKEAEDKFIELINYGLSPDVVGVDEKTGVLAMVNDGKTIQRCLILLFKLDQDDNTWKETKLTTRIMKEIKTTFKKFVVMKSEHVVGMLEFPNRVDALTRQYRENALVRYDLDSDSLLELHNNPADIKEIAEQMVAEAVIAEGEKVCKKKQKPTKN